MTGQSMPGTGASAASASRSAVIGAYRPILAPERRRVRGFVALVALATAAEGIALAMLVPLLANRDAYTLAGHQYAGSTVRAAALVVFALAGLVSAGCRYRSDAAVLRLLGDVERDIRQASTAQLLRMRWSAFLSLRLGDVNASTLLAANQIAVGAHFFTRALGALVATGILVAVSVVVAPALTGLIIVFGAGAAVLYRVGSRRASAHATELTEHANAIGATVTDVFANLKYFQSSGDVAASERETRVAFDDYARSWFRSQRYGPFVRMWFEIGATVLMAVVLAVVLIAEGHLVPSAIASLAIFARIVPRITMAQEWWQQARVQVPWVESWNRLAAAATAGARQATGRRAPTFTDRVEMIDVSFSYPEAPRPALDGVSWSLARGETVAIVGESGSGKTTMLDLITGLLLPTAGAVTVDGVATPDLDVDAWQRRIGLVQQHNPLFHVSVAENVAGTDGPPDPVRVLDVLELAQARSFVDALPAGIDTVVGEAGAKLSGGQRQRLALARALYRDPWLLVLDEPTSALDPESEQLLVATLRSLRGRCAVVVAAHRLATVRHADEVLVLADGRVVERGPFATLATTPDSALARMLTGGGEPVG